MTASLAGRCCFGGAVVGFCLGLAAQLVLLIAGIGPPRFLKLACAGTLAAVCMVGKLIHERLFLKEYNRLVVERHQRTHQ